MATGKGRLGDATIDFGALVRSGTVPAIDGFFHRDGTVRRLAYDGPQLSRFKVGTSFMPTWEHDLDDLADIDWTSSAVLASARGSVCCGEGPMGADGFFAFLDQELVPVWVVFMTNSNPFLHVQVDGMLATFTNNLGHPVVIDLSLPELPPDSRSLQPGLGRLRSTDEVVSIPGGHRHLPGPQRRHLHGP